MSNVKSFFASVIPQECAQVFIDNYTDKHPHGIRCVLLGPGIIQAIKDGIPSSTPGDPDIEISGIRVYLAEYTDKTPPSGQPCDMGRGTPGEKTVILALTEKVIDLNQSVIHRDIKDQYYDYGNPCPPREGCVGGISKLPPVTK